MSAISAVFALAVGMLVRQSAGAVSIVLIWALLVERIFINLIPRVGEDIKKVLPLTNGDWFTSAGTAGAFDPGRGPWAALLVFAVWSVGLLVMAMVITSKRDA